MNFVTNHLKNMPHKGLAFIFHQDEFSSEVMVMLDTGLGTACVQADCTAGMALADMWPAAETGEYSMHYFSWF